MHCSRTCTKWVYIWHILAFKAQTSLSMRAVSLELSLHLHRHNMGVHMTYFISECSDAPELTRAFTAIAHAHKWVFIWHILSANAQTRSSMHAVLSEPSLLSHMHKIGEHMAYSISQFSDAPVHIGSPSRAFTALAHAQNGHTYGIFFQ